MPGESLALNAKWKTQRNKIRDVLKEASILKASGEERQQKEAGKGRRQNTHKKKEVKLRKSI